MVFFTVLVIVAFAGWGPSLYSKSGRSGPVTVIRGKPVAIEEWRREGRVMQVQAQLRGAYGQLMDPGAMFGSITPAGVENSLLFPGEAAALGVTATPHEIEEQLATMPAFAGQDGKFDANRFEFFAQQVLNPAGFGKLDIEHFLADEVRVRKIAAMLASAVPATPSEIKDMFIRSRLTTEASYVVLKAADFRAAQKATEDELRKRYEAKKEFLKSPEKRRVRFAAFTLKTPEKPKPADDAKATPEAKAAEEAKKTEELQKLANDAYDFAATLGKPGVNFDEAAKQAGATIGETAQFFEREQGPPELEGSKEAAEAAFSLTKEKPYSAHIALKKGTYVLAFKEVKAPEQLPFEQVRKQLDDEIIGEKADTAMMAKARETREKLAEARKNGKSFAEAAQALGVKAEAFPAFSMMMRVPPGTPYADIIQPAAGKLAPGEVGQVIPTAGAALIVHVDQRPAVDEKGMAEATAQIAQSIQMQRQMVAFRAWLADRREAAGLKPQKNLGGMPGLE
jgi:hypothetical protein